MGSSEVKRRFRTELGDLGYREVGRRLKSNEWWGDRGKWAKRWLREERLKRLVERVGVWRLIIWILAFLLALLVAYSVF